MRWINRLRTKTDEHTLSRLARVCAVLALVMILVATLTPADWRAVLLIIAWMFLMAALATRLIRPHVEARVLVDQAGRLVQSGRYRLALQIASRAIEMKPGLADAFVVRSAAYAGLGQIDMAVDDADQAVRIAPKTTSARLARARMNSYRGLHEDALRDLQAALRERPDWAVGYMEMAQLYVKLNEYDKTLSTLETLTRHPTTPEMRYDAILLSGWVYEEKLNDLEQAIASYSRAIPLLPDRKVGYLRRALAYRMRGDMYQYAEDLLRAAERRPTPEDDGQYHWLRAICYRRRYVVTQDRRDLLAWIVALERSAMEDNAQFRKLAQRWIESLRADQQTPKFPPEPTFSLN